VEIHLPDNRVICGRRGAPVGDFLHALDEEINAPIVGAIVNHELHELTYPIKIDAMVKPVTMADPDGMLIYRRSLIFLLEAAFKKLFPESSLVVDHSVAFGGYYCEVFGREPLALNELQALENEMRWFFNQDLPFQRKEVPLDEAIEYFEMEGEEDKVRLLTHRKKKYLTLYQLGERKDYHHGYMVPSTGYLKWFGIIPTGEGFTLRFPRRHAPTQLLPMPEYPMLLKTFRQYGQWLKRLGISSVGQLNDAIQGRREQEIMLVSEALHGQGVSEIAQQITERADQVRVVLIAGPSSSGKTTFSKRLSVQLLAVGISPYTMKWTTILSIGIRPPKGKMGNPTLKQSMQSIPSGCPKISAN
jgi:uridine kinase